jgi:hypothetical protein
MQTLSQLVHQVVDVCLNVKKGENVWINSWEHTIDLASRVASLCRQRAAQPLITLTTEDYWIRSLIETPKKLLETLPSNQSATHEQTNVFIFMLGPKSPIDWKRIPPGKRDLADVWYTGSSRYMNAWREIAKDRSIRMLGIEYCLATEEWARVWGLERDRWRRVMLAGCMADQHEIAERPPNSPTSSEMVMTCMFEHLLAQTSNSALPNESQTKGTA